MTRVLVTGAAGFIGSHLIEALVRRGDEVVGIDNFDGFYPRAMKERNLREAGGGFEFHELDMLDVDALRARLTPDTVIVHLAAKAGVRPSLADPVGYAMANVTGTAAVLEAARRADVSRIAFGSSSSVYGDSTPAPFREDAVAIEPVSPYAATKRAGELLLAAVAPIYGFRSAALRFFTVYGPRQRPDPRDPRLRSPDGRGRGDHAVRRRYPGARLHVLRRHRRRRPRGRRLDGRRRRRAWRCSTWAATAPSGPATWWRRSLAPSGSSRRSSGVLCSRGTCSTPRRT